MAAHDSKTLAYRMHEAFNRRDIDAADDIFAPDFFSHPLKRAGAGAVKQAWSSMVAAHPDAHTVIQDVLADGDRVAIRFAIHGVPAVGPEDRPPEAIEVFRVAGGKIAELWGVSTLRLSTSIVS